MVTTITEPWGEYALLQSGGGRRLERWGEYAIERPEPHALWPISNNAEWKPDIVFSGGAWQSQDPAFLGGWNMAYADAVLQAKPSPFRHLGIFPEQAVNWEWLRRAVSERPGCTVLNLFAYTGAASVISAKAGAEVCHVDASRASIRWAQHNAQASGLAGTGIRWIEDDARKFMAREIRRGHAYDIILMDPPVFGRGPKGELFRLENELGGLLRQAGCLLSGRGALLLNFYATSLYPEAVARLGAELLGSKLPNLELHSLHLREKSTGNTLPTGFFLRS